MRESSEAPLRQAVHGLPEARRQPDELVTGSIWSEQLAVVGTPPVLVNRSHFEPGARTCWHTHAGGQTLVVEAGVALVQEDGGPVLALPAGFSVVCPPGVRHWHGAAPGTVMIQLAVTPSPDGVLYAEWGPAVSEEEYTAWDGAIAGPTPESPDAGAASR